MKNVHMKRVEGFSEITPATRKKLKELAAMPDSSIDFTDMPEWTEQDFASAMRLNGKSFSEAMRLYRIKKAPITARIDLDVLEWLKNQGEGYQTRLNAILRAAMMNDIRQHHRQK